MSVATQSGEKVTLPAVLEKPSSSASQQPPSWQEEFSSSEHLSFPSSQLNLFLVFFLHQIFYKIYTWWQRRKFKYIAESTSSHPSSRGFDDMPNECIAQIFSSVPGRYRKNIRLVSRRWKEVESLYRFRMARQSIFAARVSLRDSILYGIQSDIFEVLDRSEFCPSIDKAYPMKLDQFFSEYAVHSLTVTLPGLSSRILSDLRLLDLQTWHLEIYFLSKSKYFSRQPEYCSSKYSSTEYIDCTPQESMESSYHFNDSSLKCMQNFVSQLSRNDYLKRVTLNLPERDAVWERVIPALQQCRFSLKVISDKRKAEDGRIC